MAGDGARGRAGSVRIELGRAAADDDRRFEPLGTADATRAEARKVKVVVGGVAAIGLILVVAVVAAVILVFAQLA